MERGRESCEGSTASPFTSGWTLAPCAGDTQERRLHAPRINAAAAAEAAIQAPLLSKGIFNRLLILGFMRSPTARDPSRSPQSAASSKWSRRAIQHFLTSSAIERNGGQLRRSGKERAVVRQRLPIIFPNMVSHQSTIGLGSRPSKITSSLCRDVPVLSKIRRR